MNDFRYEAWRIGWKICRPHYIPSHRLHNHQFIFIITERNTYFLQIKWFVNVLVTEYYLRKLIFSYFNPKQNHYLQATRLSSSNLPYLASFSYFEKIKVHIWDHLAAWVCPSTKKKKLNAWTNLYETGYAYQSTWAHLNSVIHQFTIINTNISHSNR